MTDRWTIRRDEHGAAVAIEFDGWTVLQLAVGTERNRECTDKIVAAMNAAGLVVEVDRGSEGAGR